jgi:transposase
VERNDGKRPLGRPRLNGRIILKLIFKKVDGDTWSALLWLRIVTCGGHP